MDKNANHVIQIAKNVKEQEISAQNAMTENTSMIAISVNHVQRTARNAAEEKQVIVKNALMDID